MLETIHENCHFVPLFGRPGRAFRQPGNCYKRLQHYEIDHHPGAAKPIANASGMKTSKTATLQEAGCTVAGIFGRRMGCDRPSAGGQRARKSQVCLLLTIQATVSRPIRSPASVEPRGRNRTRCSTAQGQATNPRRPRGGFSSEAVRILYGAPWSFRFFSA
jgi:hypothetical protein